MTTIARGRWALLVALTLGGLITLPMTAQDLTQLDYTGFTLWMDCTRRGPVLAYYSIGPDTGNIDKNISPRIDENAKDCQQTSAQTYTAPERILDRYDRGHLVPANHLDDNEEAYEESYLMTNILPQERHFNQHGAWRETERLIECWREDGPVNVWIGVVWGSDSENDHFVDSHGIETPDAFVKLVYQRGSQPDAGRAIAWFLPNRDIPAMRLNDLIVPPLAVEAILGRELTLPGVDKTRWADSADWEQLTNCYP